jgi:hypothetical protein
VIQCRFNGVAIVEIIVRRLSDVVAKRGLVDAPCVSARKRATVCRRLKTLGRHLTVLKSAGMTDTCDTCVASAGDDVKGVAGFVGGVACIPSLQIIHKNRKTVNVFWK